VLTSSVGAEDPTRLRNGRRELGRGTRLRPRTPSRDRGLSETLC